MTTSVHRSIGAIAAALLTALLGLCAVPATGQPAASGSPDFRQRFDRSDSAINGGRGYSEARNTGGQLGWSESYLLMGYVEMYRATGDVAYLQRLVDHFDRVLKNRDDALGLSDAYAGKPLAGWGSERYSAGKWHVWLVHSGMITLGPAEFVHLVSRSKALQSRFAAKAAEYRARIEESIRDADANWRTGPRADEGFYYEPHLAAVQPTNQQDIFGSVLVEMYGATGNRAYRDKAARLARYFRNRLRSPAPDIYDWAYWPRETVDGPGSEDISHASINVDFAARCAEARIIFSRADAARFARTWLQVVKRPDGSHAANVAGKGVGSKYMPYAAGLWLTLCGIAPRDLSDALVADAFRALSPKEAYTSAEMLGAARLLRYVPKRRASMGGSSEEKL